MKNGMQPGDYFHSIVHMAHVAACSAKATATATFGEKAARPISCLGQLLNAIDNGAWDEAERQLARLKEGA